eukprot:1144554-Pelagomonas_calceolata.AAC.1
MVVHPQKGSNPHPISLIYLYKVQRKSMTQLTRPLFLLSHAPRHHPWQTPQGSLHKNPAAAGMVLL